MARYAKRKESRYEVVAGAPSATSQKVRLMSSTLAKSNSGKSPGISRNALPLAWGVRSPILKLRREAWELSRSRDPRQALPGARTAGYFFKAKASYWKLRRASQVLLYAVCLRHLLEKVWVLPRWRSCRLSEVEEVDVEAGLKTMPLARGSRAKIRNLMSALFSHAIRWEWTERNPIKSVRQSAKRMRTPDVLTPDEIMALFKELPEPLRTAAELDAFTGLRRGELIGLQWEDVDLENLIIHGRRSVVIMVQGAPKTEASA